MKKLSIIIGHTGFIGKTLTRTLLKMGDEVIGISRKKTDFYPNLTIECDMSKDLGRPFFEGLNNLIKQYDFITLYHLGAASFTEIDNDPWKLFENDFSMLYQVFKIIKILKKIDKVVLASSIGIKDLNDADLVQCTYNHIKKIEDLMGDIHPKIKKIILPSVWGPEMQTHRLPAKIILGTLDNYSEIKDYFLPNISVYTAVKMLILNDPSLQEEIANDSVEDFYTKVEILKRYSNRIRTEYDKELLQTIQSLKEHK